ncbi:hypothetical protein [Sporosarcina sp. A2]|uniref:hypothetical protein n=1 Tax=Sporosarcina sp. A2 TaxID=3393449 RepID=UPI003D7A1911
MKKIAVLIAAGFILTACGNSSEEATDKSNVVESDVKKNHVEANKEIEVSIQAEPTILEDNKVMISGETNIPDGGQLMFTLNGPEYTAQMKAVIDNGVFKTDVFSDHGEGLPAGKYTLEVSLSIASTQDENFVKKVGKEYEYLNGSFMDEGDLGKTMNYETSFSVEETEQVSEEVTVVDTEIDTISDSQTLTLESLQGIFDDYSAEDDELVSLNMDGNTIRAVLKLAPNPYLDSADLAPTRFSQLTDELLDHEG